MWEAILRNQPLDYTMLLWLCNIFLNFWKLRNILHNLSMSPLHTVRNIIAQTIETNTLRNNIERLRAALQVDLADSCNTVYTFIGWFTRSFEISEPIRSTYSCSRNKRYLRKINHSLKKVPNFRAPCKTPLLSKLHRKARLKFVQEHNVISPDSSDKTDCGQMRTKWSHSDTNQESIC